MSQKRKNHIDDILFELRKNRAFLAEILNVKQAAISYQFTQSTDLSEKIYNKYLEALKPYMQNSNFDSSQNFTGAGEISQTNEGGSLNFQGNSKGKVEEHNHYSNNDALIDVLREQTMMLNEQIRYYRETAQNRFNLYDRQFEKIIEILNKLSENKGL